MKPSITALAQLSIIALLVSFTVVNSGREVVSRHEDKPIATCYGKKDCNACKNCKFCKHCAKDGGSCGVCKASTEK